MADNLKNVQALVAAVQSAIPKDAAQSREQLAALTAGRALIAQMQRDAVQQDDHAGSPAPSPVAEVDDWRDGQFTRHAAYLPSGAKLYTHPAPSAQSSKAALSDEAARLSEDDLHARSWWCPTCKRDVPPEMVTKDGEHYLEAGGCGYGVRGELIEDQPKQPLSDEEFDEALRSWDEHCEEGRSCSYPDCSCPFTADEPFTVCKDAVPQER